MRRAIIGLLLFLVIFGSSCSAPTPTAQDTAVPDEAFEMIPTKTVLNSSVIHL